MKRKESYWQEIFDTVDMKFLPVNYMKSIEVEFISGELWEIDLMQQETEEVPVDQVLDDFFEEYQDTIETVDFRLDLQQLKKDIGKRTHKFLKLNK